jgi:hypothetical protein
MSFEHTLIIGLNEDRVFSSMFLNTKPQHLKVEVLDKAGQIVAHSLVRSTLEESHNGKSPINTIRFVREGSAWKRFWGWVLEKFPFDELELKYYQNQGGKCLIKVGGDRTKAGNYKLRITLA